MVAGDVTAVLEANMLKEMDFAWVLGIAKIQGYVNFACYKTGDHGCFVPWLEMVKVRGHTREFGGGFWRARISNMKN